jgi:hypothetical protein
MSWLPVDGRQSVSAQLSELVAPQQANRSVEMAKNIVVLVALSALAFLAAATEPLWLCIIVPVMVITACDLYKAVFPSSSRPWYSGWFTSQSSYSSSSSDYWDTSDSSSSSDYWDTSDSSSSWGTSDSRSSFSDDLVRSPIAVSSDHGHVIPGVG